MQDYLSADTTDYQNQARKVFKKIKSTLEANQLQPRASTKIEIRGQDKKKNFFILAFFSTNAEVRPFEHQARKEEGKELSR